MQIETFAWPWNWQPVQTTNIPSSKFNIPSSKFNILSWNWHVCITWSLLAAANLRACLCLETITSLFLKTENKRKINWATLSLLAYLCLPALYLCLSYSTVLIMLIELSSYPCPTALYLSFFFTSVLKEKWLIILLWRSLCWWNNDSYVLKVLKKNRINLKFHVFMGC